MTDVRAYYSEGGASAAFYDVITAADVALTGDVELYASLVPPGGSVLELGSGTGRVARQLAENGFEVVGLELSAAMLDQAEGRRPANLRLAYVAADMRQFDLGRTFDAVICPFYALAHLPPEDWIAVLRCAAGHLKKGGVAAFHMPMEDKMAAPAPPSGTPVFRSDGLTLYMAEKTFDGESGRFDLTLDYVPEGSSPHRERLTLYAGDLTPIALEAGFAPGAPAVDLGGAGIVHLFRSV